MDMLLGIGTPMAAKAGLNVLAPKLMPKIEKGLEVPFKAVKNMGGGIARAVRGPSTPAEAFAHQLTHSGIPGAAEHAQAVQSAPMPHIEHMLPPRGPK
jgi:hypothetical protein